MLLEELLPLGDLQPQGRILMGNAHNIDLGVLGYSFQSLLLPELKNVAGKRISKM
jgi:hypothetical protein